MLSLSYINKSFNGKKVLNDVSLKVRKGEVVTLIGPSGSGKTTLLRIINGFVLPDGGEVYFDGLKVDFRKKEMLRNIRKKIGKIYQQFNLVERATALENVMMGALGKYDRGIDYLMTSLGFFPKEVKEKALYLLEYVGLADQAYVRTDRLSGGQKQRVAIARALMQDPEVLLADEPISNLDPGTSRKIINQLLKISKERGITLICVLHQIYYVQEFDRVVALKDGKIYFDGPQSDFSLDMARDLYKTELEEVYFEVQSPKPIFETSVVVPFSGNPLSIL
ncbi:phosphonate ABC transporter ATP-binding protein [Thermodesulfobacterium sp. TA1]|uniref:phosphonate ABC transporter ATP-binding protein n=1 Tax=Thermodesulfobacterium sp. TA1 TaxID=2234087 RepID=UPI001231C0C4|nr:phosphonate ABC transporter ATP-binding protein [Thermodesulfobacterium sp. TA1]QER41874.1 phosphonate ABC transporter ATP-binding protein [Thermodesulfobacterium sp. TA1]